MFANDFATFTVHIWFIQTLKTVAKFSHRHVKANIHDFFLLSTLKTEISENHPAFNNHLFPINIQFAFVHFPERKSRFEAIEHNRFNLPTQVAAHFDLHCLFPFGVVRFHACIISASPRESIHFCSVLKRFSKKK